MKKNDKTVLGIGFAKSFSFSLASSILFSFHFEHPQPSRRSMPACPRETEMGQTSGLERTPRGSGGSPTAPPSPLPACAPPPLASSVRTFRSSRARKLHRGRNFAIRGIRSLQGAAQTLRDAEKGDCCFFDAFAESMLSLFSFFLPRGEARGDSCASLTGG